MRHTRPTPSVAASGPTASSATTTTADESARARRVAAGSAGADAEQVAAAEAACTAFTATVERPLPELRALRLALATRCQGIAALAAGEPVAGLGPRLLRRLQRAAAAWERWRPAGAPDAASELLRRADLGADVGALVRDFVVAAHRQARRARAEQPARLDAAHRRARRQRETILAAWPDWLKRDRDRLVLDPGDRFLQVSRLPSADVLASPQLRRWLRAITALQWFAPASAVELTDPDGRYTYIPLDAGRLQPDGDRTRSPWISSQPRRLLALQRAQHAIRGHSGTDFLVGNDGPNRPPGGASPNDGE